VDAEEKPLGRLAVGIANLLRGKNKPTYSPQVDVGSFVIVVNGSKVKLSGNKAEKKFHDRYTGFRSGLKRVSSGTLRSTHPDRLIKLAVRGMLPKNKLCAEAFKRLRIYADAQHPHGAQRPTKVEIV
jgi:large subunit ribosomal protein L13